MIDNYNQALKKSPCLYLTLTALLLSSGSYGSDLSLREDGNHSLKERLTLSSIKDNRAEELERKPRYAFGITEDEVQKDIKQPPQEKSFLKKQAKKAAKQAAAQAAKEKVYSMSENETEAKLIIKSIMERKKLKDKEKKNENHLFHLTQNMAMNAARQAALEAAVNILHDEEEAGKVVAKLKLDHYAKKENKNGGKVKRSKPTTSKVTTLQDLKLDQSRTPKKQPVSSKLEKAKTGTEMGVKILDVGLKVGEFLMKVI
ncbi:hypothetical protein IM40_09680 (plasmid) [Candidatus Paracaedimonas acanthamoebae]|nr:hypothetical protein IM40_09680 [Candidatus Paracaedimonas acanthamoebae]